MKGFRKKHPVVLKNLDTWPWIIVGVLAILALVSATSKAAVHDP